MINDTPRARWRELTEQLQVPLQQSWTYGTAVAAMGGEVQRVEVRERRRTVALAQAIGRRFFWPVTLITRGPDWIDAPDQDQRARFVRDMPGPPRRCPDNAAG